MSEEFLINVATDYPDLRQTVSRLCEAFPGAYWRKLENHSGDRDSYPTEFIGELTRQGFLAALIPEQYGGSGLPLRAGAVILETVNAMGCNAAAGHAQMYTMAILLRHGSQNQREKYLPKIASGKLRLQAFGVTEPTSGSDTTQIKTRAERTADGYVINGQKIWTSRAQHSDLMLLLARTAPLQSVSKRTDGISVFLIDLRDAVGRGCEIRPIETMINHNTTEVFFNDLKIPHDSLIGEEGRGFRYVLDGMNAERCLTASEAIGNGRYFVGRAVAYANERSVFGRKIGQNQGIQFPIASALAQIEAADLMVRKATAMFDSGHPCGTEANMARLLAAEAAWAAAEACFSAFGGFAFATEYDVERKWREARLARTAPISTNMILSHIATHALGLPKSY